MGKNRGLRGSFDFALTKAIDGYHVQRTDRAMEAALITVSMIIVVALGWMSMLTAGLLASGAMLLTGCIDYKKAARSIDWGTLVVIACAINPIGQIVGQGQRRREFVPFVGLQRNARNRADEMPALTQSSAVS